MSLCESCGARETSRRRCLSCEPAPPGLEDTALEPPRDRRRFAQGIRPGEGFLVSDLLEVPCRLFRGTPTTLGRDPESNIVLPAQVVSRRHALVRWDGDGFAVFDAGSTNGLYVNGESVVACRLEHGDTIGIGPFEFGFRTHLPNGGLVPRHGDTAVFAQPASFSGELGPVSLAEIWQLLELNQKTGLLDVRSEGQRGSVWFSRGAPVHAECGGLAGNRAALALLLLAHGTFRFSGKERVRVVRNVQGSSCALLLEAARMADEQGKPAPGKGGTARLASPAASLQEGAEPCSR